MKELLELEFKINEDSKKMLTRELYDLSKRGVDIGINLDKKSVKKVNKTLNELEKEGKEAAENWADAWEKSIEKTQDHIKQLASGLENLGSGSGDRIAKGISGGFLRGLGSVTSQFGKSMSQMGKESGGATGALLKGLGPAVGLLGAAVSSLASFVMLLIDSEHTAKALNKSLLEGGMAASDLGKGFFDIRKSLDVLRDSATDVVNNLKWGTIAEEQIEMINAFNASGLSIKKVVDYTASAEDQMGKYMSVTSLALTYSKLLGTSASDMAADASRFMENFGGGLKYIEEQFASIHKASQDSGYSVKWFYSTIQQATSGMSMYNVRIAESAGMLIKMSRALGQQGGADMLQQMTGKYKNMGYTEKIKKTLVTGTGITKKAFVGQKEDSGFEIKKIMESASESEKETMKEAVSMLGLKSKSGGDPDFENMTEKELNKLSSYIQEIGEGALSRKLTAYRSVKEGSSGDVLDMAENLDMLGPQQTLIMEMNAAAAVFGKSIDEVDGIEIAGWEAATGQSGEEFRKLKEIATSLEADFSNVQDLAKIAATDKGEKGIKARKKIENQFGLYVDEFGKVFDKKGGTEIKSKEDLVMASDDRYKNIAAEAMDRNTAMAQQVAENTTDIAKKIDIVIAGYLEKIYHIFEKLWSWLPSLDLFGGDLSYEDKQEKLESVKKEEEKTDSDLEKASVEFSNMSREASRLTGMDRVAADAELEKKAADIEALKEYQKYLDKQYDRISSATTNTELHDAVAADPVWAEKAAKARGAGRSLPELEMVDGELKETGRMVSEYDSKNFNDKVQEYMTKHAPDAVGKSTAVSAELKKQYASGMKIEDIFSHENMSKQIEFAASRDDKLESDKKGITGKLIDGMLPTVEKILPYTMGIFSAETIDAVGSVAKNIMGPRDVADMTAIDDLGESGLSKPSYGNTLTYASQEVEGYKAIGIGEKRNKSLEAGAELKKSLALLGGATEKEAEDVYWDAMEEMAGIINKHDDDKMKKYAIEEKDRLKKIERTEEEQKRNQAQDIIDGDFKNLIKLKQMDRLSESYASMTEEERKAAAEGLGMDIDSYAYLMGDKSYNLPPEFKRDDFIYSPQRGIIPFSDKDTVVGAKPGGPIDKMMGRGGGGGNVVINVYGGDEQKLVKVIKKVLEQYGM